MDRAALEVADKITTEQITYVKILFYLAIAAILSAIPAIVRGWFDLKLAIENRKNPKEKSKTCGPDSCPFGDVVDDIKQMNNTISGEGEALDNTYNKVLEIISRVREIQLKSENMKDDNRKMIGILEDLYDWHKPTEGKFLWYREEDIDNLVKKISENLALSDRDIKEIRDTFKEHSKNIENILNNQVNASRDLRYELNAIRTIFEALGRRRDD